MEKQSMEQYVYEELKKAILNRELAPGNQLTESVIASKLTVSRTPIRNALKRLANEGYVNNVPNRGAFVIQPTIDEIMQAFELRKELELIGLRCAFDKITEDDLEEMSRLTSLEIQSIEKRDFIEYLRLNKEFHLVFVRRTGNKHLIEFTEKIIDQINIYLALYDLFYDVDKETIHSVKEHPEIIQSIRNHDYPKTKELLNEHLKFSLEGIRSKKIGYTSLNNLF